MPGHLGSPDAGKKGGKERLLPRTMISDQQSAPGSWRWARGTHSLLPEPGERMRIQAEGPGRGPEPLSTSLPPGKGGGLPPRVWEGAPSSVHHCGAGDEWLLALVLCNPQPCQPPQPCGASRARGSLCARRRHKGRGEPQLPPPAPPPPTCTLGGLLFTRGQHLSNTY